MKEKINSKSDIEIFESSIKEIENGLDNQLIGKLKTLKYFEREGLSNEI